MMTRRSSATRYLQLPVRRPTLHTLIKAGNAMKRFSLLISLLAAMVAATPAGALDIKAREYVLMDFQTGAILDQKDADKRMPPSSMSKLMTAYMVFDALKTGRLSLDD